MKTLSFSTFFVLVLMFIPLDISASCSSQHSCNGCDINFTQTSTSFYYIMDCEGWETIEYSGEGDYQGTFCNGEEPCNVPQEQEPESN